ncbi:interferon-induced protein 44-like isoform X3 [Dicentrarchus labrax]|uniref:Interferon-induced protein 44-like n=1 Tax=Dicentrarchus labrax TaxID=13489 RepID=A0A8C4F890_DICLA|nr:interferon-induced protein 44-like isoform X3 [Dicentrarchus labrax]XP_051244184.1 interferon-induced protein 44-like isoform X3 [Dicentrarchus labrax]XP_051244185.1 interferon-induced protein 44-like isoform X3 [Dicentrarchus labrax]XP_051244186.1 interferon-induced protein 44-like isoform X3 [Dicentrarchus labrax]
MGGLFSEPWRTLPENNEDNLDFMKSYQPRNKDVKHLRILIHGQTGAGKSSFINSVESVLKGRITGRAFTDATSGRSFTEEYTTYKIQKDPESYYSFIFNDTMGLEKYNTHGIHVEDIQLVLKGHVKEGYQFNPKNQLTKSDQHYKSSPTLDDRVHVLVSVCPADKVSLLTDEVIKKMRDIRLAASKMKIPHLAVLTKVDLACPEAKKNINNVYKSDYLKKQVEKFSETLGIPENCIFLVKNYNSEIETNDDINVLILVALRQMVNFGEDFLDNL